MAGPASKSLQRKSSLETFKRDLIRRAAREVFVRRGLVDTTLREIAAQAGCTTGAIYAQYDSKEDVYGDILRQSLAEVLQTMQSALADLPRERSPTALRAIFTYYTEHTAEFELGFYLKSGATRLGLGARLNRELNAALKAVFDCLAQALVDDRLCTRRSADRRATLAITALFGLLLMEKTGRLAALGQDVRLLLADQIAALKG